MRGVCVEAQERGSDGAKGCSDVVNGERMPVKRAVRSVIVVVGVLLGICVLFALPAVPLVVSSYWYMSTRHRTTLTLPDGVHAIEHSRIPINIVVAEYSRDVTYITNGVRGKTTPLRIDTCGGYPINCYLIETPRGPLLRLDDRVSEHLLDVANQTTYAVTRVQGKAYIGELRDEDACSGWSMRSHDPSTLSVTIGGAEAKPMTDLTQNAAEVYLGRFSGGRRDLHFTLASQAPEVPIEHQFARWEKGGTTRPDPLSQSKENEMKSEQTAKESWN